MAQLATPERRRNGRTNDYPKPELLSIRFEASLIQECREKHVVVLKPPRRPTSVGGGDGNGSGENSS